MPTAAEHLGAKEQYVDYSEMLEKSDLDAVIIGTPMHFHVPQAIPALQRGLHVLSEFPAVISMEECRDLVASCKQSEAVYMMAENYLYTRTNTTIREMARKGSLRHYLLRGRRIPARVEGTQRKYRVAKKMADRHGGCHLWYTLSRAASSVDARGSRGKRMLCG